MSSDRFNQREFDKLEKVKDDESSEPYYILFLVGLAGLIRHISQSGVSLSNQKKTQIIGNAYRNFLTEKRSVRLNSLRNVVRRQFNISKASVVSNTFNLNAKAGKKTNIILIRSLKKELQELSKGNYKGLVNKISNQIKPSKTYHLTAKELKKFDSVGVKQIKQRMKRMIKQDALTPSKAVRVIDKVHKTRNKGIVYSRLTLQKSIMEDKLSDIIAKTLKKKRIKIWKTLLDNRVRAKHKKAHNQKRINDKKFLVWSEKLKYPRDKIASLKNKINCRCYVIYKFNKP